MGQPVIQTSFVAGEWAPALNARVDLAKYHSGAALLRNFFVDYRGGATTRPGSKYVQQVLQTGARLIPFQASLAVSYMLEFGNGYIRFYNNGIPVLDASVAITGITHANPVTIQTASTTYNNGDWVYLVGINGMTELNGSVYQIINFNGPAANFQLAQLYNANAGVDTTTFGTYTGGGAAQRIYTLGSPYINSDLPNLKFVQDVNQLIITHPNHPPYVLTLNSQASWTIQPAIFTPTISTPGAAVASTASAGNQAVGYVVTAVDVNGQESAPSTPAILVSRNLLGQNWSTAVSFGAIPGAVSYNVYRSQISAFNAIASGAQYGFVGNCTGVQFVDTNIIPDFAQTPPIVQNPFSGSGVSTVTLTSSGGGYGAVPVVVIDPPPAGGIQASAFASCTSLSGNTSLVTPGFGYVAGDTLSGPGGIAIRVDSVVGPGSIAGFTVVNYGNVNFPSGLPTTAISFGGGSGTGATFTVVWGVSRITLTNPGTGYTSTPHVTISGGGATAVATLGTSSSGNPTVAGFFQQRLVLGAPVLSPSQMNFSQPGSPFNFNISQPVQADDAIQTTLTNTTLNTIQSLTPVSAGLIALSDKGAWLINGGSAGSAISALNIVANAQAYSGSSGLPPIVTPNDILYVQSKGSIVRDLAYNFYLNNYVGTDISIFSSHLFYGYQLNYWAWAEEPFKIAWAIRNDGILLSLTFAKEQEMVAWARHDTQGAFTSVAAITENTSIGEVDAVYVIVQRTVNGHIVQYIERFVELNYPNNYKSSWQVDAGIGYNGSPATKFAGAQHLGGFVCTGLADGVVINFTMPITGVFKFGPGGTPGLTGIASASIVTVGLAFLPQLQTLRLDLGEPTVQGKRKKIAAVTARVWQSLGLSIGNTFSTLVAMKDLIIGNIGTMSNTPVTGLVTEDARTIIDANWTVQGQVCFQQNNPYPATILGVIPEIEVGDTK